MRRLRRWLHPETPPPGFRGVYCCPEVGLPEGFVLPSAALVLPATALAVVKVIPLEPGMTYDWFGRGK